MVVESYGVWRAKPVRYTYEDRHSDSLSPHLKLYFTDDEAGEGQAAINIKSGDRAESRLAYWTLPHFTHPITEKLAVLNDSFQLLAGTSEQAPGGLALDFIRGNLFRRSDGRILGHDVEGPDNDILDQLKPILDRAISADATVYIYGSHFSDGKGIHNVHMNQGNSRRWEGDNGVFQDGALIFKFEDNWEAVFIAFASQAVCTEDGPNDAGQPLPWTGYTTWENFLARLRPSTLHSPEEMATSHANPATAMASTTGLKILSLDGGGIQAVSELFILRQIMSLIDVDNLRKPCEVFDLICGSSTGGSAFSKFMSLKLWYYKG